MSYDLSEEGKVPISLSRQAIAYIGVFFFAPVGGTLVWVMMVLISIFIFYDASVLNAVLLNQRTKVSMWIPQLCLFAFLPRALLGLKIWGQVMRAIDLVPESAISKLSGLKDRCAL
jgi:hypothetical protein